ncbi:MAG: prepilin-type N-terminal cleavage/methylation domain-containing protein [Candidatus Hydrogenedentes bacterium]|nr:prepilin-type N-terminal cleavage/methylation domain-containing protein [Candidatus Hydrogenedentota bacterium]
MYRVFREERGFSPIEVLIAMAILAIGIVAIMKLFPSGLRASRVAQERTIASELADSNLGRMRMTGVSNLLGMARANDLYKYSTANAVYTHGSQLDDSHVIDGMATVVSRVAGPLDENRVRVVFSVDFPDGRRENFVTYVTDY